ncbi:hypothetical protein [Roseobacter sp. HKCCA0434]|uniref:hypothetical protein n=1 Tax=Roseobacter sp. HKCCA0434 TaxID=3079297 RepID=UPI002905B639|nr:hypothetical protein [Roseobacter sp. HKCCA0434]
MPDTTEILKAALDRDRRQTDGVRALQIAAELLEHAAYEMIGDRGPALAARLIRMAAEVDTLTRTPTGLPN